MAQKSNSETGDKTCIKGMCFSGFGDNSTATCVDVKDGKMLRIRPLHWD